MLQRLFRFGLLWLASLAAHAQIAEVCTIRPSSVPAKGSWELACALNLTSSVHETNYFTPTVGVRQTCASEVPPPPPASADPLDAFALAKLIPTVGYTVSAQTDRILLVTLNPVSKGGHAVKQADLTHLNNIITELLTTIPSHPPAFSVELVVPHAPALGALSSSLGGITTRFTVTASGKDRVVVTSANNLWPTCDEWHTFLRDLRAQVWSVMPTPGEMRLTALDASSAATALSAVAGSSSSASSAASSPASATPPAASFTISVGAGAAGASGATGATGATGAAGTQTTITVASTPAAAATGATGPTAVAGGGSSVVTIGAIEPDLLAFSGTTTGDDAAIAERQRILSVLDLPRPEVSISAWVMQNSSVDPDSVTRISQLVREQVAHYNDGLTQSIVRGWQYLLRAKDNPGFFNHAFHDYLTQRFLLSADPPVGAGTLGGEARQVLYEANGGTIPGPDQAVFEQTHTGRVTWGEYLGTCPRERYCLGYTTLFSPLQPRLTDLLLTLIAASSPYTEAGCAIDAAEMKPLPGGYPCKGTQPVPVPVLMRACSPREPASPCAIWQSMKDPKLQSPWDILRQDAVTKDLDCRQADYYDTLRSMLQVTGDDPPILAQNCFRRTTELFKPPDGQPVNQLGLVRAAIADFLFNYKMSQQYPHEFVAYDLKTSAQAMNAALRPLVDAFLQDVTAYQAVLKRQLGLRVEDINRHTTRSTLLDKPRFLNNAIITVNTIANSEASSDTATESYLEQINAPTLSALAGTLSGAAPAGTPLSNMFANMSFGEAQVFAAGLQQLQTSHMHIGRDLSVDFKPTALLGANSAEIQVSLKADDEAGSGAYSSGNQTGDAEVSRFSKGETTTRVRIDSLKLFEVSSFSSQLTTPKKRFPLLPPAIELPYIGSLLSVPLPPSREFHSSIAVMSAVVIPTAADLAFNTRFVSDRLLAVSESLGGTSRDEDDTPCRLPGGPGMPQEASICKTRTLLSLRDFRGRPVREYNRMMTHCLATNGSSPESNGLPADDPKSNSICNHLQFTDVLGDLNY